MSTSSQCSSRFPGDHCVRKIPRCNQSGHTNRLSGNENLLRCYRTRNDFTVNATCLFGKPFHERIAVRNFAKCFGQRFSRFGRHNFGDALFVGLQQCKPFLRFKSIHLILTGKIKSINFRTFSNVERSLAVSAFHAGE